MEQQKQLQSLSNEYQSLQNGMAIFLTLGERRVLVTMLIVFLDMSTLVTARQKLESQQQENKGVQKVRLQNCQDLRERTRLII